MYWCLTTALDGVWERRLRTVRKQPAAVLAIVPVVPAIVLHRPRLITTDGWPEYFPAPANFNEEWRHTGYETIHGLHRRMLLVRTGPAITDTPAEHFPTGAPRKAGPAGQPPGGRGTPEKSGSAASPPHRPAYDGHAVPTKHRAAVSGHLPPRGNRPTALRPAGPVDESARQRGSSMRSVAG